MENYFVAEYTWAVPGYGLILFATKDVLILYDDLYTVLWILLPPAVFEVIAPMYE